MKMLKLGLAALLALAVTLPADPALAQIGYRVVVSNCSGAVYNVGSTSPIYVDAKGKNCSPAPVAVLSGEVPLAVSNVSARVALPSTAAGATSITVFNKGASDVYIAMGDATIVATSGGTCTSASGPSCQVAAGTSVNFYSASPYIAAITASSTSSLVIYQASGPVNFAGGGGSGGGGGGGGAVTIADGAAVTLGNTTDAKSTATDGTAVSAISVLKEISATNQAPPSRAVTNAGTFPVQNNAATPAGANIIGKVSTVDSGGTDATDTTNHAIKVNVVAGGAGGGAATIADGADVTQGAKADAKSAATDTTAVTIMQVLKEISAMVQAPPSQAVTNAGTFPVQSISRQTSTDISGTITVGGTFQTAAASSGTRNNCTVQNPSSATESLKVKIGTMAQAFELAPGQAISALNGNVVATDAITVTATTAGHIFAGTCQ